MFQSSKVMPGRSHRFVQSLYVSNVVAHTRVGNTRGAEEALQTALKHGVKIPSAFISLMKQ